MLETVLSGVVNRILKDSISIFTKLTLLMYYGTEMIALNFGVK